MSWLKIIQQAVREAPNRRVSGDALGNSFFFFEPWQSGSSAKPGTVRRQIHLENEARLPRARIWENKLRRIASKKPTITFPQIFYKYLNSMKKKKGWQVFSEYRRSTQPEGISRNRAVTWLNALRIQLRSGCRVRVFCSREQRRSENETFKERRKSGTIFRVSFSRRLY